MPADLIPALPVTVLPSAGPLALAYAMRGQCSRRVWSPTAVPASAILARLADEVDTGEIPRDVWGGVDRPHEWTVQPCRELVPLRVVQQAQSLMPEVDR